MNSYSRSHLSDSTLLSDLRTHLSQERGSTAELVADIGEVDARRLYAPAGYSSMFAYCVEQLHLSEDAAYKRIQVARAARAFPAIFGAIADGRLHLSGAVLIAPHLNAENAESLIRATTHKSKRVIEQLIAERFPRSELLGLVQAIPVSECEFRPEEAGAQLAPGQVESAITPAAPHPPTARVTPVGPQKYAYQFNVAQSGHEKFEYLRALLGHQVPSGNRDEIFELAMDLAIRELEKSKFSATSQPRDARRPTQSPRHIPARVQRAVWVRDGGRCSFVGENGHRCDARRSLEFDHIQPVARGGDSSVGNVRLLCRTHNQLEAERTYGAAFVQTKRDQSALEATKKRTEEVIPWLVALKCTAAEARRAAEKSAAIPDATLEQRVRFAVSQLGPRPQPPRISHLSQ